MLACGIGMTLRWFGLEREKKQLDDANGRWEAGHREEAVAVYRKLIASGVMADKGQEPVVYLRVIEYDLERGNVDSTRQLADRALGNGVNLRSDDVKTGEVLAGFKAERERRIAAELGKRKEEDKLQAEQREAERRTAPRLAVEITKVRLVPFRTATGMDTTMVCVDWKNTGTRPVRALSAKIVCVDKGGREVYSVPDYYIYAVVANDRPGIGPGQAYIEPSDEGHIIPPLDSLQVVRVNVSVVRVEERVPE
jgi:hypothetical protein